MASTWEPSFAASPNGHVAEWPGFPIGQGNDVTRLKGRTSLRDKTLDKDPHKVAMELFRLLHQAASCYGLNTILSKDPGMKNKQEAVLTTNELLFRTVEEQPRALRLTVDN